MLNSSFSFTLNGHQLKMFKANNNLNFEACNGTSGKKFFFQLENSAVSDSTQHIFHNIDELYAGITKAYNNLKSGYGLTFGNDGYLNYYPPACEESEEEHMYFSLCFQEAEKDSADIKA
jgi:hypothetical protein